MHSIAAMRGVFHLPNKEAFARVPEKGAVPPDVWKLMGPEAAVDAPRPLPLNANVLEVCAGGSFNVVVNSEGFVFVDAPEETSAAIMVGSSLALGKHVELQPNMRARGIAAGMFHVVLWNDAHELWTWGFNIDLSPHGIVKTSNLGDVSGQLGRGLLGRALGPGRVTLPPRSGRLLGASCGASHSLVLTELGLYGFGLNREHQVCEADDGVIGVPVSIPIVERVRVVACGSHHSLVVCTTGSVFAWGWNEQGQVNGKGGNPAVVSRPTLLSFKDNERATAVAAGLFHSLALSRDGIVLSWGSNTFGQLGRKESARNWHVDCAEEFFSSIACSSLGSFASSDCGVVFVWGHLQDLALTGHQPVPRRVDSDFVVKGVSGGAHHAVFRLCVEKESVVMQDFCIKSQDPKSVHAMIQSMGQSVPQGFGEQQHLAHRAISAKKLGAAVRVNFSVLVWTSSSDQTFSLDLRSLRQKPVYVDASFISAPAAVNKLTVVIEGTGVVFAKHSHVLRVHASFQAAVSPLVLVLGGVWLSFTLEKDRKARKPPSSSFLVLLVRTPPDVFSKSFAALPMTNGPRSGPASPSPGRSGSETNTPRTSAPNSRPSSASSSPRNLHAINPLLELVHSDKRELTRKCALDGNLPYAQLIECLVKYPDREDDLAAFVNTMPMWSSARDVLTFLQQDDACIKLGGKTRNFVAYVARCAPWAEAEEMQELGKRMLEVFGSPAILQATEGKSMLRLLIKVWPGNDVESVDRKVLVRAVQDYQDRLDENRGESLSGATMVDSLVNKGLLVERGESLLLTRRTRAHMTEDWLNDVPINLEYVIFAESFSTGFETVEMRDHWMGEARLVRVFLVEDVIRMSPQLSTAGVLAVLQSLVECGVLAIASSSTPSLVAMSSLLFFTRFGLKTQLLSSANFALLTSPNRLSFTSSSSDFLIGGGITPRRSSPRMTASRSMFVGPPPVLESVVIGVEEHVNMTEVARQISILFQKLYLVIRPAHLLEQRWCKEENNPAFLLFKLIKNLSNLCVRTLLNATNRQESLHRLLVMGTSLLALHNFSGAFAVALGIMQHVVSRLELPLTPVGQGMFDELTAFVDSSRNYNNYRSRLAAVDRAESCVPYFGLVTQSITLIEEGNPTLLKLESGEKVVNRDKVHLMWNVLQTFFGWQGSAYSLITVGNIRQWLIEELVHKPPISEEELYALSYQIKSVKGQDSSKTGIHL